MCDYEPMDNKNLQSAFLRQLSASLQGSAATCAPPPQPDLSFDSHPMLRGKTVLSSGSGGEVPSFVKKMSSNDWQDAPKVDLVASLPGDCSTPSFEPAHCLTPDQFACGAKPTGARDHLSKRRPGEWDEMQAALLAIRAAYSPAGAFQASGPVAISSTPPALEPDAGRSTEPAAVALSEDVAADDDDAPFIPPVTRADEDVVLSVRVAPRPSTPTPTVEPSDLCSGTCGPLSEPNILHGATVGAVAFDGARWLDGVGDIFADADGASDGPDSPTDCDDDAGSVGSVTSSDSFAAVAVRERPRARVGADASPPDSRNAREEDNAASNRDAAGRVVCRQTARRLAYMAADATPAAASTSAQAPADHVTRAPLVATPPAVVAFDALADVHHSPTLLVVDPSAASAGPVGRAATTPTRGAAADASAECVGLGAVDDVLAAAMSSVELASAMLGRGAPAPRGARATRASSSAESSDGGWGGVPFELSDMDAVVPPGGVAVGCVVPLRAAGADDEAGGATASVTHAQRGTIVSAVIRGGIYDDDDADDDDDVDEFSF